MAPALTPKQEKFALAYIETSNASEAYRQAYDTKATDKTIWESASKLLADPKVKARVKELQRMHQERHAVTVDSITRELEEARAMAIVEKQTSAAVSASMGKAKLHGLIIDKGDITHRKPITELTDDELDAEITEYERAAGAVLPGATN